MAVAAAAAPASASEQAASPVGGVDDAEALMADLFPHLRIAGGSSRSASPAPLDDDALCVVCMDAPRDTPLRACAQRHAPVLCAPCAAIVRATGAAPSCPWCGTAVDEA